MDGSVKIEGLEAAMKGLQAAFPDNLKKQQAMINGAIGGSARKSFLPVAKQLAKRGDGSGALSQALAVRAMSARKRRSTKGRAGGMELVPVRYNPKAIALYIRHYYTNAGKAMPLGGIDGIRHGHLVEFGHNVVRGGKVVGHVPASSFLWASTSMKPQYRALFAKELMKRIESSVKREAKKKAKGK